MKKIFLIPLLHYLRMWDKTAAERVDYFIANSENTAKRIKKFYNRESKVIYPPVDISRRNRSRPVPTSFAMTDTNKNYFLIISRLTPYKKIDVAIEAFNKLELPLIIIGDGEDRKRLEKMAVKNIKFLGFQPEEKIAEYYQNCQALIFPGEDDFGITPVEAMSFGKPVLAYRKGGALETIIEGETGEFFDDPIPEILADGIRRIKNNYDSYNPEKIKKQAERFSESVFKENIKKFINSLV